MGRGILHKRVHQQKARRSGEVEDHMLAAAHHGIVPPEPPPPPPETVTLTRPQFDSLLARLAALEAGPQLSSPGEP